MVRPSDGLVCQPDSFPLPALWASLLQLNVMQGEQCGAE